MENEVELVDGRRRGEIIDHAQVEAATDAFRFGVFGRALRSTVVGRRGLVGCLTGSDTTGVAQCGRHFAVDEVRVLSRDDGARLVPVAVGGRDVDIEFLADVLRQCDVDAALGDVGFSCRHVVGRHVAEHFESVGRAADEHAECDGDGESDHVGAGNAHPHGVFEDVGTEAHLHAVGRARWELFGRPCGGQCHADGFGAADGGHHLFAHKGDDFLSEGIRKHGIGVGIVVG